MAVDPREGVVEEQEELIGEDAEGLDGLPGVADQVNVDGLMVDDLVAMEEERESDGDKMLSEDRKSVV